VLISVRHVTSYRYAEPVRYTIQCLRLTPVPFKGQRIVSWEVKAPGNKPPTRFTDGFGNLVHVVAINTPHTDLVIEAGGLVETEDCNGVVSAIANPCPVRVFLRQTPQTRPDAAIADLAKSSKLEDTLESLHELSRQVRERVEYVPGTTDVHTEAAAALADGKGVCQDHAHIFIAACRCLDVPARYVTGYLHLGEGEGAEAHHAWAEDWVDGLGWVGFDVANRVCPTESYVRLASGLDAGYAAPIKGSRRGGSGESMEVSVAVQQQQESAQQ
jgi:transglutaminase-like putative cysteine protease